MIRVSIAGNGNLEEWDEYVNAHADSCVFQTFAWRNVVTSTYGHQPFYLMVKRGAQVCGVLPLFLINSRLFCRVLATCPYASTGAICADDVEAARALLEKAIQLARERYVGYLELKSTTISDCDLLQRHTDFMDYRLVLDDPDNLWTKRLKGRARTALRKADSFQLTYSRGHEFIDDFYHIVSINMRRLGTPVHAKSFYQCILSSFGRRADICVARYKTIPISTLLTVRHREEVSVLYASSLSDYWHANPNEFIYWKAIKDAYSSGATIFDFGRSLAGSGQAKFKESWGPEAKPLYYEYFLNRCKTIPRIHQSNPRYQLATSVWRHMPLGLTRLLGPHLIKSIP